MFIRSKIFDDLRIHPVDILRAISGTFHNFQLSFVSQRDFQIRFMRILKQTI